ncbi:MAG: hypothetical protein E7604_07295 [Ruminococcaceae bacterium]|nr:hypothetical protein [Oscillospiraceae bacterium]
MTMKLRYICICILLLLSALLCCACTESKSDVPPLTLVGEGAPAYTVVRGDNAASGDVDGMVLFNKYMKACGISFAVTTDWEQNPVSEYEIIIGETLRGDTDPNFTFDSHDCGPNGWYVITAGNRIYIGGGTPAMTVNAVEHFLKTFFGYSGDPEVGSTITAVTVPGDYAYIEKQEFVLSDIMLGEIPLRDYRIVWDEGMSSMTAKSIAQSLQDTLYYGYGIWVDIDAKNEGTGPVIQLSKADDGSFSISQSDGTLLLSADDGSFTRGWKKFEKEHFADKQGAFHMENGFTFTVDTGSAVYYSEFGAVGDGKTDDLSAIIATHEYANKYGIPVKADAGAVYYIASVGTAIINTDTDWTGASFIIDDKTVPLDKRGTVIFDITASKASYSITNDVTPPKKGQENLGITLPEKSMVFLTDSDTKRYIREGVNANSGSNQTDILIVDTDGTVDPLAPILWDYEQLTDVKVVPMDAKTLTVKGGTFTTVVADNITDPTYYNRGIRIRRSNVVIDGVVHYVENETEEIGAPYGGIIIPQDCADVTIRNCVFTPHFTFRYHLEDGSPFTQGTYDLLPTRSVHLTVENCSQTVDINDNRYWGITGSNFCKNTVYRNCSLSRVDAHQGVANLTVIGCEIGYAGMSVIGSGTLLVEDTKLNGYHMISLRSDYGSTWDGDFIIRNCEWTPNWGKEFSEAATVFQGSYSGYHDFGYECYMPHNITIDGLHINDAKALAGWRGMYLFSNITPAHKNAAYESDVAANGYPYHITESLTIRNFTSESGKSWRLSSNEFMFRTIDIIEE